MPVAAALPKDVSEVLQLSALPVPTLGHCAHTTYLGLTFGFLALAWGPAGTECGTKQDSMALGPLQPQAGQLF